jgi:hypothetical protein
MYIVFLKNNCAARVKLYLIIRVIDCAFFNEGRIINFIKSLIKQIINQSEFTNLL